MKAQVDTVNIHIGGSTRTVILKTTLIGSIVYSTELTVTEGTTHGKVGFEPTPAALRELAANMLKHADAIEKNVA